MTDMACETQLKCCTTHTQHMCLHSLLKLLSEPSCCFCRSGNDGSIYDVTPAALGEAHSPGFNVRTRVHEYGGGEHLVVAGKA